MKNITPEELLEKLENGQELNIIDVRESDEVAGGMVPGAKHIPMGEIPERLEELDKDKEYIFICRSGGRSGNVCSYLDNLGYKTVNMVGGMLEWNGELEWNDQNS
jgi:rhodanese-related sulfurtransferase